MTENKSFIVLTPDGQEKIWCSHNTTVLELLEEICQRHGYNVDEYDLKHYNKILDVNMIMRFTRIRNNSQLEMVPCTKPRITSKVTVGIQLENGEQLMGDFMPDDTLAEVLTTLCPNEDLKTAVIIYMYREDHGKSLERTTLKSMGFTSGKVMLRLIHRDSEQLNKQVRDAPTWFKQAHDDSYSSTNCTNKVLDPITCQNKADNMKSQDLKHVQNTNIKNEEKRLDNNKIVNTCESPNSNDEKDKHQGTEEDINIHFLGERNALVFNKADAQVLPREELPDNFFNLTVKDAKILLRIAKRRREELEEAPLLTAAQRQLEQNEKMLDQLNKYRRTVLRIYFPDQLVLQASFKPLETVQAVKEFIKNYLSDPTCEFTIYTTPPKYILNPEARLIDEKLVPSAIVHYSGRSSLKETIKNQLTDPKFANIQAIKTRMNRVSEERMEMGGQKSESSQDIAIPGPSGC